MFSKTFKLIASIGLLLLFTLVTSCSSEDEVVETKVQPQIIVMYSIGGLGDGGYNDAILSGIQAFRKDYTNDIDLYHYSPTSEDEARRLLYDWLSRPESNIPALFIAAASDYDSLVVEALDSIPLTANKQMLMFESKRRNLPITTFSISMYGASFLAGITAAHCEGDSALVVLGSAQDETIKTAADGFTDGYAYAEPSKKVNIEYLADDWTGFSAAALAYSKMFDWAPRYSFIFPVAGGSNSGIYRYTREYPTASPYVAGMDTDQSELSNLLVGSLTKFIESIIYEHLYSWLMTGEMPESQTYGLRSGCVFWLVSPHYEDRFEQLVEDSYDVAVEREEAYYAE